MSTVIHPANSLAAGAAVPDGVARLGLVDSVGASLANLTEAPQTIGSGPRCSVRLGGRGLRPLHCVITPGKNGPIVRRWATETRLNGLDFTEASLSAGDLLRIGSIDLRVIELPSDQPAGEASEAETPEAELFDAETGSSATALAELGLPPLSETDWLDDSIDDSIDQLIAAVASANHAAHEADVDIDAELSGGDEPWEAEGFVDAQGEDSPVPFGEGTPPTSEPEESDADLQQQSFYQTRFAQPGFAEEAPAAVGDGADSDVDTWLTSVANHVEAAVPTIERLRERAATRHARVLALVAALRAERRQSADLAQAASDLASQLEQALIASDEAGVELARLVHEGAAADEDLAATRYALDEAGRRAEQLEAQVADLEAQVAELQSHTPALEAHVAELEATLAAFAKAPEPNDAIEPVGEDLSLPVDGPADHVAEADSWALTGAVSEDADAVPVFADEVWGSESQPDPYLSDAAEAGEEGPPSWPAQPETHGAQNAEEPLWGIERLATEEAPSLLDSPWGATAAEPVATQIPTEEPTEASIGDSSNVELDSDSRCFTEAPLTSEEEEWETTCEPASIIDEHVERLAALLDGEKTASAGESAAPTADGGELCGDDQEQTVAAPEPAPEVSYIERFASLLPEDDEPVEQPAQVAEAPTPGASHDDESIDDYMRKLLQRMRGSSTEEAATATNDETPRKKSLAPALPTAPEPAPVKAEMLRDLSELRRSPSPEGNTDMGALRQLANQSARHAIDVAQSRQSREQATFRLMVSVISLGVGTLASIFAPSPLDLQFIGGFASVAIGGWFFVRTVRQCQTRTLDEQIALAAKQTG